MKSTAHLLKLAVNHLQPAAVILRPKRVRESHWKGKHRHLCRLERWFLEYKSVDRQKTYMDYDKLYGDRETYAAPVQVVAVELKHK